MMYTSLQNNVLNHIILDHDELEFFISQFNFKKLNKKDLILNEGQFCKKLFFVNSGVLRAFHLNNEGKETTVMFAIKDWWITDMYCFLNNRVAFLSIEALDNSEILEITKEKFDDILAKIPKLEKFFRILMQNAYTREQLRNIENLSMTAQERYKSFINKYPQMLEKLSQKQISSYLGITPEFLSIIKKK